MVAVEELSSAVRELTAVVKALDKLLRDEYPKRSEVEQRFISRQQGRRNLAVLLVAALITVIASYFFTIGTISYCFLGNTENPPSACSALPGYDESVKKNNVILKQFNNLIHTTEANKKRLDRLEERGRPGRS